MIAHYKLPMIKMINYHPSSLAMPRCRLAKQAGALSALSGALRGALRLAPGDGVTLWYPLVIFQPLNMAIYSEMFQ